MEKGGILENGGRIRGKKEENLSKNWKPIEWCLKKFQRIRSKMSARAKTAKKAELTGEGGTCYEFNGNYLCQQYGTRPFSEVDEAGIQNKSGSAGILSGHIVGRSGCRRIQRCM